MGGDGEYAVLQLQQLAVQIDGVDIVTLHPDTPAAVEGNQIRHFCVPAGFVLADNLCYLQAGHLSNQQDVQQSIVQFCIRNGMEAAAIPPAVGDADQSVAAVKDLPVDGDAVMLMDTFQQVGDQRQNIGARAGDQGQALIFTNGCADAGVQTDGADIQGVVVAALERSN